MGVTIRIPILGDFREMTSNSSASLDSAKRRTKLHFYSTAFFILCYSRARFPFPLGTVTPAGERMMLHGKHAVKEL